MMMFSKYPTTASNSASEAEELKKYAWIRSCFKSLKKNYLDTFNHAGENSPAR